MTMGSARSGFTLVELLVVIAIIVVLAAFSVPAVQRSLESGRRSTCTANLKTLSQSMLSFANDNNGAFPSTVFRGKSWLSALAQSGYIPPPTAYAANRGKSFLYCPSACHLRPPDPGNWTTYCINDYAGERDPQVGAQTPLGMRQARLAMPAEFALLMDGCYINGFYAANANPFDQPPSATHGSSAAVDDPDGGVNVAFADGHVEMIKKRDIPTDSTDVFWRGTR